MSIPDWHEGSRESDRVIISGLASGGRTDMWVAQVSRDGRSTWSGRHLAVFDNHEDALRVLKVVNAAATASENSHATPNADHALDLHEGGGTSTPHGEFPPALELPGRFVVGPDAQVHGVRSGQLTPGTIVNVNALSPAGSALCWIRGHFAGYVDPRHLTPAPEPAAAPAAAPAVDDDLLLTIAQALYGDALEDEPAHMRAVLASEPMQRLKAAWATEVRGAGRDMLRMVGEALGRFDAEPMWLDELARQVVRERDDARTELRRYIDEGGHTAWDVVAERNDEISALKAEVERLRAAQELPDVGPVTRDGDRPYYLWVDNCNLYGADDILAQAERSNLLGLARVRAARAFLATETADARGDDEPTVDDVLGRISAAIANGPCLCSETVSCEPHRLLDEAEQLLINAHRARDGQEAGQ